MLSEMTIPETFNAAAYFVDRNVAEGRGAKIAIECGDERVTYQQLLERVNRVGNALRDRLQVRIEERIPGVLECAVIGRCDQDRLVKPAAYVVLRENVHGTPELATELQQFVRTKLAEYKHPRWVEFVTQLPRTATGKIQRFTLREAADAALSSSGARL